MADQAYAKFASLDAFDLVKGKQEPAKANPFDMGQAKKQVNNNASLADLKKNSSNVSTCLWNTVGRPIEDNNSRMSLLSLSLHRPRRNQ